MWPLQRWAELLRAVWNEDPTLRVALVGYPEIPLHHFAEDDRLIDCRDLPLTVAY
jgi:hypothetical protein